MSGQLSKYTCRHIDMSTCQLEDISTLVNEVMAKPQRKSLADALQAESTRVPKSQPQTEPIAAVKEGEGPRSENTQSPTSASGSYVAPSRRGKKVVSGYFDAEVSKQLKLLCVENDTSLQALLTEALNDLFVKHGKSPIA